MNQLIYEKRRLECRVILDRVHKSQMCYYYTSDDRNNKSSQPPIEINESILISFNISKH